VNSVYEHSQSVVKAKRKLDVAKARQATASAKEEASAEIAKDFSWKAGTEMGKAEAYKEGFFKAKGRAAADHRMSKNLVHMRAKEGKTKKTLSAHEKDWSGKVRGLSAEEKHGKAEMNHHEETLQKIRHATRKAFAKAEGKGVPQVKVDKLKTKEKVVKIKNGRITEEMQKDEAALKMAKSLHANKGASKQQKLAAMKGEVRGLMFLKALNTKATGALKSVDRLKKELAASNAKANAKALAVAKATNNLKKKLPADAAKTKAAVQAHTAKQAISGHTSLVLLQEQETVPAYFAELEGTAHMNAEHEEQAAHNWKLQLQASHEGKMKMRSHGKPCMCQGLSNKDQHGSSCKDWEGDGTQPWCYVSWACSKGTTSSTMARVKWLTCTKAKAGSTTGRDVVPLAETKAPQKQVKVSAAAVGNDSDLGSPKGDTSCTCSKTKNSRGEGAVCARAGYSEPWCYVSILCDRGLISQQISNTKWITGCSGAPHQLGEPKAKPHSMYEEERLQLGESSGLEDTGQGLTRNGWSWGLILPSNSPYPGCINECKSNPTCVGASYSANDIPSTDPAAPSVAASTCHQFSGITQKNDNPSWQTWLSPRHQS